MRAYFDERLLKCGDWWWWVDRYQSPPQARLRGLVGDGVQSKVHQAKGGLRFAFEGHYIPPKVLSEAEQLNGVDPQPIEFEGNMSVVFDVARCRNCIDGSDNQWSDNYSLGMGISKRHGQWIINEFTDPYNSLRKPMCVDGSGNVKFADEYLTPKTRFNGDYRLKELETNTNAAPAQGSLQISGKKVKVADRYWQFVVLLPPGQWFDTGIPVIVNKMITIRTENKQPRSEWTMKIAGYDFPRGQYGDTIHINEGGETKGDRYGNLSMLPQEAPTIQLYLKGTQPTHLEITIEDYGRCLQCIVGCPEEHSRLHDQGKMKAERLLAKIGG
jgi:hypothetical protein